MVARSRLPIAVIALAALLSAPPVTGAAGLDTPANVPVAEWSPYLGDYDSLLAVEKDFYGIFSASNVPDQAHFPNGVQFQRNANFASRRLLGGDGTSTVRPSIDPFFFRVRP